MRVRRAVDLSLAVDPDTRVYPGDPVVRFETAATIGADGFNLLRLHIGSQSGTNCDAPYHFDPAGARIDEVDPAPFAGPAVLIDVRGLAPRNPVGPDLVSPYLPGLERIDFADPFLTVFPLRLTGADGSPTRAVALDLETI